MSNQNFKTLESLEPVEKVITEAGMAVSSKSRTIETSAIPEVLGGVAGAGAGAVGSFTALYMLGTVGLSAAGITSGLAAAGAIVGGGMVAGIGVLAAPVALLSVAGYGVLAHRKHKKLLQAKKELLRRAIQYRDAILCELEAKYQETEEHVKYLTTLNTLLQAAIRDLKDDLAA